MSMVDVGTRYQGAVLIDSEKSDKFIKAINRNWCSLWSIHATNLVTEGRGWLSEKFGSWTDEQGIHHGKAVEIYCQDHSSNPKVAGFSQHNGFLALNLASLPGDLLQTELSPAHLGGSKNFEKVLMKTSLAEMALTQAETDNKLLLSFNRKADQRSTGLPSRLNFFDVHRAPHPEIGKSTVHLTPDLQAANMIS